MKLLFIPYEKHTFTGSLFVEMLLPKNVSTLVIHKLNLLLTLSLSLITALVCILKAVASVTNIKLKWCFVISNDILW